LYVILNAANSTSSNRIFKKEKKGGGGGEKATKDQPIPLFTLLKMGTPKCYAALQMTRHAIDKAY